LKLVNDDEQDEDLQNRAPKLLNVVLPSEADKALAEQEPQPFEEQLNELVEKMNASLKLPAKLTELSSLLEKLLNSENASEQIEELAKQIFPLFYELFNIRLRAHKTSVRLQNYN
jgi:DNA repair ATPase RecN